MYEQAHTKQSEDMVYTPLYPPIGRVHIIAIARILSWVCKTCPHFDGVKLTLVLALNAKLNTYTQTDSNCNIPYCFSS